MQALIITPVQTHRFSKDFWQKQVREDSMQLSGHMAEKGLHVVLMIINPATST